jgi:hypothetical protein
MAETSQLMHERGEKLANLADKSAQLQQVGTMGHKTGAKRAVL